MTPYVGRFAPSPTGPLHAGSVVAALASWLDAKAHMGTWLIRIEDVDEPRCKPEHSHRILQQLSELGLHSDQPVVWQSQRKQAYANSLSNLKQRGAAYGCACSRKDILRALESAGQMRERNGELIYPGTCANGANDKAIRAWRFKIPAKNSAMSWHDRRLGVQRQNVAQEVGDFVVLRADGYYAYQLAVVVDDADQGVTHVVRGEDLTDNTARQILLQQALGYCTPQYLHTPLVLAENGEKLSKQNGAAAIDTSKPVQTLDEAAQRLGLKSALGLEMSAWQQQAVEQWRGLYNLTL